MKRSAPLTNDANGAAIQVFSPSKQLTGSEFTVNASTIFSPMVDVVVTYDTGESISVLAGEIFGVPYSVEEMTLDTAADVRFAGHAVIGHAAKFDELPLPGHTFEAASTGGYSVVTDGTEDSIEWRDIQGTVLGTGENPVIAPTMATKLVVALIKANAPTAYATVKNTPHGIEDTFFLANENGDFGDFTYDRGLGTSAGSGNRATFYDSDGVEHGSNVAGCYADLVGTVFESPVRDAQGNIESLTVSASPINDGHPGSESGVNSSTFGIFVTPTLDIIESFGYPQPFFKRSGNSPR